MLQGDGGQDVGVARIGGVRENIPNKGGRPLPPVQYDEHVINVAVRYFPAVWTYFKFLFSGE